MEIFYYKLGKKVIFVGVLFFVSHLLFPQYTYAAEIPEDQMRFQFSRMNIANSPEPIIFDKSDAKVETAELAQPIGLAAAPVMTLPARPADLAKSQPYKTEPYDSQAIREYVRQEAINAGLNPDEVEKIVKCESGFNPHAVNNRNKNGTKDMGLWQINSLHRRISDADKFDYKKATKWAITKRLHDGNWSAWVCARKLGIR